MWTCFREIDSNLIILGRLEPNGPEFGVCQSEFFMFNKPLFPTLDHNTYAFEIAKNVCQCRQVEARFVNIELKVIDVDQLVVIGRYFSSFLGFERWSLHLLHCSSFKGVRSIGFASLCHLNIPNYIFSVESDAPHWIWFKKTTTCHFSCYKSIGGKTLIFSFIICYIVERLCRIWSGLGKWQLIMIRLGMKWYESEKIRCGDYSRHTTIGPNSRKKIITQMSFRLQFLINPLQRSCPRQYVIKNRMDEEHCQEFFANLLKLHRLIIIMITIVLSSEWSVLPAVSHSSELTYLSPMIQTNSHYGASNSYTIPNCIELISKAYCKDDHKDFVLPLVSNF